MHVSPAAFSYHGPGPSSICDRHGHRAALSAAGAVVEPTGSKWPTPSLYTVGGLVFLLLSLSGCCGSPTSPMREILRPLPYIADFFIDLRPRDWFDPVSALFDLPTPYDDGSLKFDYPDGRVYLTTSIYIPEYFYRMLETLNIALFSTLIGFTFGFLLCFFAARNLTASRSLRFAPAACSNRPRLPRSSIAGFFWRSSRCTHSAIRALTRRASKDVLRRGAADNATRGAKAVGATGSTRLVRQSAAGAANFTLLLRFGSTCGRRHHRRVGAGGIGSPQAVDHPRPRGQDHRHVFLLFCTSRRRQFSHGCAALVGTSILIRTRG